MAQQPTLYKEALGQAQGLDRPEESRSEILGGHSPGGPDLRLHVGGHAFGSTNDHIGDSVSQAGRAAGVTLPHPADRGGG